MLLAREVADAGAGPVTAMARRFAAAALACIGWACGVAAQVPAGYPASYQQLVSAANREGKLVVYSVTSSVPALLQDFRSLYPGIELEYVALDTGPLYDRVLGESAAGSTADVVWSSAMDLQMKLVADGHAARYDSPEAANIPGWALWRNEAFGSTFEPVGFVYNKDQIAPHEVPRTRAELMKLAKESPARFDNRITAFDPEKSGLGYLLLTQDAQAAPAGQFWELAATLGSMHVYRGTGSGAQFERLAKGESVLGYDLLLSYATGRIRKDLPNLGVVLPLDHTLVVTRVMFISRHARHPHAARLWVDYLLSKRGQQQLAAADLGSLRRDVDDAFTPAALQQRLGDAVKPIAVGPALVTSLEASRRRDFIERWNAAIGTPR